MKIKAIVRDHSDDKHTAARTESPATKGVVEFAPKNYLGEGLPEEYSVKGGLFMDSKGTSHTVRRCIDRGRNLPK